MLIINVLEVIIVSIVSKVSEKQKTRMLLLPSNRAACLLQAKFCDGAARRMHFTALFDRAQKR
jgi:predicted nucleotidyltransferase